MAVIYYIDDYRPDPDDLEAAMRRHPSSRRTVTLTPKGERWLRAAYTGAITVGVTLAALLIMAIVGAIETGGL